jgi:N-methylhydantoinase A/oxoprolinase/acetone carboxylase beta subunit
LPRADLRLGLAVGRTHTDGVVLAGAGRLLMKAKVPATAGFGPSIAAAVGELTVGRGIPPGGITRVMVATDRIAGALTDRADLTRVATLRIGSPLTHAVPPLASWPRALRDGVSAGVALVRGGTEFDGREAVPLDADAVRRFVVNAAPALGSVAITSVFSPLSADHELAAADIVREELGPLCPVSLSHEIGSIGLLARENATVLNAALGGAAAALAATLERVLRAAGIGAEALFAQNDGTIMALHQALRFPMLMIGGVAAVGMRGGARLGGVEDGVVVDVGGASTRIGVLLNGFPRESSSAIRVAGVLTGFRAPEIQDLPVGGGSIVRIDQDVATVSTAVVGPDRRALVFGGETPTLLDAAVAADRTRVGDHPVPVSRRRPLTQALSAFDVRLVEAIDHATAGMPPPAVIAVGGAGALVPDPLAGVAEIVRPVDGDVAGALGAAIAPVGGHADIICPNRPDRLRRSLDDARATAMARAVHAGADPDRVEIVDVEEIPLSYLADPAVRIRVKAAGPHG